MCHKEALHILPTVLNSASLVDRHLVWLVVHHMHLCTVVDT